MSLRERAPEKLSDRDGWVSHLDRPFFLFCKLLMGNPSHNNSQLSSQTSIMTSLFNASTPSVSTTKMTKFQKQPMMNHSQSNQYRPITPPQDHDQMDVDPPTQSSLPKELLALIFSHLNLDQRIQVSKVNLLWRSVCLPTIWSDPHWSNLKSFRSWIRILASNPWLGHFVKKINPHPHWSDQWSRFVTLSDLDTILRFCPQIQYLHLDRCFRLDESALVSLVAWKKRQCGAGGSFGTLEHLSLSWTCFPDTSLALLSHLSSLQSLSLVGVSMSESTLQVLIRSLPRLQRLELSKMHRVTDVICSDLGLYARQLRYLDISCCWNVTDVGMLHLLKRLRARVRVSDPDRVRYWMRMHGLRQEQLERVVGHY